MDEHSFDAFYRRWAPEVYTYSRHLVGHDLAQDVTQETMIVAARLRAKLPREDRPLRAWLRRAAFNQVRKALDRQDHQLTPDVVSLEVAEYREGHYEHVESAVLERIVATEVIRSLSERDRRLFFLAYDEGLTNEQIAASMGMTYTNVTSSLQRVNARVLKAVNEYQAAANGHSKAADKPAARKDKASPKASHLKGGASHEPRN